MCFTDGLLLNMYIGLILKCFYLYFLKKTSFIPSIKIVLLNTLKTSNTIIFFIY